MPKFVEDIEDAEIAVNAEDTEIVEDIEYRIAQDIEDAEDIENAEIAVNAEDIEGAEIISISQILDMYV